MVTSNIPVMQSSLPCLCPCLASVIRLPNFHIPFSINCLQLLISCCPLYGLWLEYLWEFTGSGTIMTGFNKYVVMWQCINLQYRDTAWGKGRESGELNCIKGCVSSRQIQHLYTFVCSHALLCSPALLHTRWKNLQGWKRISVERPHTDFAMSITKPTQLSPAFCL